LSGLDDKLTKLKEINPHRNMQLPEETFGVLREHAVTYYSSPTYYEVIINLVEFYEKNDGPKYHYD